MYNDFYGFLKKLREVSNNENKITKQMGMCCDTRFTTALQHRYGVLLVSFFPGNC